VFAVLRFISEIFAWEVVVWMPEMIMRVTKTVVVALPGRIAISVADAATVMLADAE
jgi:hypothetical protein